jgi:hypothetical protein
MKSDSSSGCSQEVLTPDPATSASALLREFEEQFKVDSVPPVPVERIATSLLDLLIDEADDLRLLPGAPRDHGHLSGILDVANKTIWLDRDEARRHPRRRRFTIAHEIGHLKLHATADEASFFDRPQDISDVDSAPASTSALRKREAEANTFAKELLLPELCVREQAEITGCDLAAMAERFDVSVPAVRLRLFTLDLLPIWMRTR